MSLLTFQQTGYWYQDKSQPLFQDITISFEKGSFIQLSAPPERKNNVSVSGGLPTHLKREASFITEKTSPKSD